MEILTIQFSDVGPRKLSWTADVPRPLTYHGLMREIQKHQALGSRDVDFDDNGGIYVPMFRRVGSWAIVEPTPPCDAVGERPTAHLTGPRA